MAEIYPANLLTDCFVTYDSSMGRLDHRLDIMQQKQNKKHIQHAVSTTPLICDVLSLSLAMLDSRRKDILLLRYRDGKTLRECGEIYDVSAERIRQLARTALHTVREHSITPMIALIWPDTVEVTPDEWLEWIVEQSQDEDNQPLPYASLPTESKRILITKVSERPQDEYNNAVKE